MKTLAKATALILICLLGFTACEKPVNIFTLQQDKALGTQLQLEIESNPAEYPILPEAGNDSVYAYIRAMRDTILNSGVVSYKDEFAWALKIIQDDSTLNAFCAPGGYIYVYTGLIKYLDSVDHLAGVLAHEIAHADQRHSTAQMTTQYGIDALILVATGNGSQSQIAEMAKGL
jgi:predicted Zn-dependent protease